ncbi:LOW QUALITY PROTEIN: UDP-glycosyltransferase 89B1 [Amborella trichopoda]|uniref:LOW QUALITY PROTEIN: UDP-glycosyltransferase 89B1 n=1 Tax=Amborella trichopoda TaxID=13333 RepID=UPI0009C08856|nr:LOW QUALITY PROTEIN: UDP-glycosyltransferase 89B1 [Amborella trichopoda]|eukprot:XP_011623318.2 LOW QUALITY PROTEIN: UDP-glycosyltransferase 89B1 [Amborella trichopoda]
MEADQSSIPTRTSVPDMEAPHVLIFPFPTPGHVRPLFLLAAALASRGVRITILALPSLPSLSSFFSSASSSSLPISSVTHPWPPPYPHCSHLRHIPWLYRIRCSLARSLSIPRLTFYTCSAFVISILHSLWLNDTPEPEPIKSITEAHGPIPCSARLTISDIPGAPTFPFGHLSLLFRTYKKQAQKAAQSGEHDPAWVSVRECFLSNISSYGSVFNSFMEAEAEYLLHLKSSRSGGNIWAVGPVHLLPQVQTVTARSWAEEWLEGHAKGSVIYVCFGTQATLSSQQVDTIAEGLKASGVPFLWAMPEEWLVPSELELERAHTLLSPVVAAQARILGHGAVAAFLTHCGWNSMLEGLVAGVPMVGLPMGADQYLNARLLVDGLGAGTMACDYGTVLNPGSLARAVTLVMEPGSKERARARACRALVPGGSSRAQLENLVEDLQRLHASGV